MSPNDRTWRSGLCKPPVQLLAKLSGAELRRVFLSLLMLVLLLGSYSTIAISSNNHSAASIINLLQYTQFFQDRGLPLSAREPVENRTQLERTIINKLFFVICILNFIFGDIHIPNSFQLCEHSLA